MATILIMDDTESPYGGMSQGCKYRLEEAKFNCVTDTGRNADGDIVGSATELGQRLYDLAIQHEVFGVVIDVKWGDHDGWNGFDIYSYAKNDLGLAIDRSLFVFLSQHFIQSDLNELARSHGIAEEQVFRKGHQSNDAIAEWFTDRR